MAGRKGQSLTSHSEKELRRNYRQWMQFSVKRKWCWRFDHIDLCLSGCPWDLVLNKQNKLLQFFGPWTYFEDVFAYLNMCVFVWHWTCLPICLLAFLSISVSLEDPSNWKGTKLRTVAQCSFGTFFQTACGYLCSLHQRLTLRPPQKWNYATWPQLYNVQVRMYR